MSANMLNNLHVTYVSALEIKEPARHIREDKDSIFYCQDIIARSADGREVHLCFHFDEETNKKLEADFQAWLAVMKSPDSTLRRVTP